MLKKLFRLALLAIVLASAGSAQGNSAATIAQMMSGVQQNAQVTGGLYQQAQQSGNQQAMQVLQYENQVHQQMYAMLSQMQPMASMMDQNPQAYQQLCTVWREYQSRCTSHNWSQGGQSPMPAGYPSQQQQGYPTQNAYPAPNGFPGQQPGYPSQNGFPMQQHQPGYPAQSGQTAPGFRSTTGGPAGQNARPTYANGF